MPNLCLIINFVSNDLIGEGENFPLYSVLVLPRLINSGQIIKLFSSGLVIKLKIKQEKLNRKTDLIHVHRRIKTCSDCKMRLKEVIEPGIF